MDIKKPPEPGAVFWLQPSYLVFLGAGFWGVFFTGVLGAGFCAAAGLDKIAMLFLKAAFSGSNCSPLFR